MWAPGIQRWTKQTTSHLYAGRRESGRYKHFHRVIGRRWMEWSNKDSLVKWHLERDYIGKESSREQEQKVQRLRMGAFTQNTYNVGESLFSDIWVITGFGFNLSMVSPNYRCLYLCHNNQSKLLLIEIVTFKWVHPFFLECMCAQNIIIE